MLRILLFSDLQLDRPYEWATPEIARSRRAEARDALVRLIGIARERSVDVIACAGNLFDRYTVKPATAEWLAASLRSAGMPVLIAPGDLDFIGPLGGYAQYSWPENVTVFEAAAPVPVQLGEATIWGAAHTEAHRVASPLETVRTEPDTVNIVLFHGCEADGRAREPGVEACAVFRDADVERSGFDHALVGHYATAYLGAHHTYPGMPIALDFGGSPTGSAALVTVDGGRVDREIVPVPSTALHEVSVDLTGVESAPAAVEEARRRLGDRHGVLRLRLRGTLPVDLAVSRDDLDQLGEAPGQVITCCDEGLTVDIGEIETEATIRGEFVRHVLASGLPEERRRRVLLAGLRALAGADELVEPL